MCDSEFLLKAYVKALCPDLRVYDTEDVKEHSEHLCQAYIEVRGKTQSGRIVLMQQQNSDIKPADRPYQPMMCMIGSELQPTKACAYQKLLSKCYGLNVYQRAENDTMVCVKTFASSVDEMKMELALNGVKC